MSAVAVGHECEQHNNPADFFLDVINANQSLVAESKFTMKLFLP